MRLTGPDEVTNISYRRCIFGVGYGALTAATYFSMRQFSVNGGLVLFVQSCLFLFLIHLSLWPKLTLSGILNRSLILRGILFGITQYCLLTAQDIGATSSMFMGAIAGLVTGSIFGHFVLNETPTRRELLALALCVAGLGLGTSNLTASLWAVAGGVVQGLSGIASRSLMKSKRSRRESISSGFFVAAVLCFCFLTSQGRADEVLSISWLFLVGTSIGIVVVQYSYFTLYKLFDAQKAALISMSRVPWAVVLEFFVLGTTPVLLQWGGFALVLFGASLPILNVLIQTALTSKSELKSEFSSK